MNDFIMYNIDSLTALLFILGMYNFVKAFLWPTSIRDSRHRQFSNILSLIYDNASKMTSSGKCACANSFEQMSLAIGLCFGMVCFSGSQAQGATIKPKCHRFHDLNTINKLVFMYVITGSCHACDTFFVY
jgi:hypothetical protein